jgi:hypothetical protein
MESPASEAPTEREVHEVVSHAAADPYHGVALGVECAWPAMDCFRNAAQQTLQR